MSYSVKIPVGNVGSFEINEDGGVASVKISAGASIGGGSVAGSLKAVASAELDMDVKLLIDAGFDLAAHKFPAASALILAAKAGVDAELAKV